MQQPIDRTGRGARGVLLLASFGVYLALTCVLAAVKPMWNDEIFTFQIARRPTTAEVLRVLGSTDLNPPLHYLAVRASQAALGENPVALRLPSALGFAVFCLSLYLFVGRRAGPAFGGVAAAFPLATGAFPFAYEARPYGVMLGFCGLALVCWQRASEEGRRPAWLIGLAASLAAAVSSHFYAILLPVPLALGEVARSFERRRIDLGIWVALGAAVLPLAVFLPAVGAARVSGQNFWAAPDAHAVYRTYDSLFGGMTTPLVETLLLLALLPAIGCSRSEVEHSPHQAVPRYEIVVAAGFALMPVFTLTLARFVTHAYTERYALPTVAGLALLVPLIVRRVSGGRAFFGVALTTILLGWFVAEVRWSIDGFRGRCALARSLDKVEDGGPPVVVSDPLFYLQLRHYVPGEPGSRLVYLVCDGDTVAPALHALESWMPLRVERLTAFTASHSRFYVYGQRDGGPVANQATARLLAALEAQGTRLALKEWNTDRLLFEAEAR